MAKITTGELYNEWQSINDKLDKLNEKVDSVIDDGAIETRLTGSIVSESIFMLETIPANTRFDFTLTFGDVYAFTLNCRVEDNAAKLSPQYMFSHGTNYYSASYSYDLPVEDVIRPSGFMSKKIDVLHSVVRFYIYNNTDNDADTSLMVRSFGSGVVTVV